MKDFYKRLPKFVRWIVEVWLQPIACILAVPVMVVAFIGILIRDSWKEFK